MSVRRCQQEISAAEFGEWLALWQLESEEQGGGEPTLEGTTAKIMAWATSASSAAPRGVTLERRG